MLALSDATALESRVRGLERHRVPDVPSGMTYAEWRRRMLWWRRVSSRPCLTSRIALLLLTPIERYGELRTLPLLVLELSVGWFVLKYAGWVVPLIAVSLVTVLTLKYEAARWGCRRWLARPLCRHCDYDCAGCETDLSEVPARASAAQGGLPERCPECGTQWPTVPPEARAAACRLFFASFP